MVLRLNNKYLLLKYLTILIPTGIVCLICGYNILVAGPYSYIQLGNNYIHTISLISIFAGYSVYNQNLKSISMPARQLISGVFVVYTIYLYDIFWVIFYTFINKLPSPTTFQGTLFLMLIGMLVYFNIKHKFLSSDLKYVLLSITSVFIVFLLLSFSGFFLNMFNYQIGIGTDPNQNIFWAISKFVTLTSGVWLLIPNENKKEKENETIDFNNIL